MAETSKVTHSQNKNGWTDGCNGDGVQIPGSTVGFTNIFIQNDNKQTKPTNTKMLFCVNTPLLYTCFVHKKF